MSQPFPHDDLVIATHNPGKLREFQTLLKDHIKKISSASEEGIDEPAETGTTFVENALLKGQHAAKETGKVALADDSGLCVTALNGEPGIFSARWAGPNKDFFQAMSRVEDRMKGASDRGAYFISVLALVWPDGYSEIFEGRVWGTLIWPPRGTHGFGYDPIFLPNGESETFGEMDPSKKDQLSHRGKALQKLFERAKI